jgi:hypothetical protein
VDAENGLDGADGENGQGDESGQRDDRIVADIHEALRRAVDELASANARDEALARFVPARRVLLFTKEPVMEPVGRVWRLGVLLLDREAGLYATGSITRSIEPGRAAYQSVSAEVRRGYRAAAFRSHFEPGETVNYDASPIELDAGALRSGSGPLFIRDGAAWVRWSLSAPADAATEFGQYLADRVGLLVNPPAGA